MGVSPPSVAGRFAAVFVIVLAFILPFQAAPARASGGSPSPEQIVWDGDIYLNETVSILSNQTLVVRPGATIHIRGVAVSCTEGNLPILEINGSLRAQGTSEKPISFISGEDLEGCAGREAMVIYTRDRNATSVLTNVRFTGGNLLLSGISASIKDCSFNWTFLDIGDDRSAFDNCTFMDSPVYFHTASRTAIQNCKFGRTGQDEIGIHISSGVSVIGCRISGCLFGLEATIGTTSDVRDNVISGCSEGVHSMGNLSISNNTFTDNTVGINSTAGFDIVRGNIISGNDIGVVTFGDPGAFLCNTFQLNGARNARADIQQKLLVQGDIVDGNGLALRAPASITDSFGNRVFDGDPAYVILTRSERLSNGSEMTYAPFTAAAELKGDRDSIRFDGFYRANFTLRLERLLPQLTVERFDGPKTGTRPGDEVILNITVKNQGEVAAGHFLVQFSVDGRPVLSRPVWGLGPGGQTNLTFRWTAREGSHSLSITADPGQSSATGNLTDEVRETDEEDNSITVGTDIKVAPGLPSISVGLMMLLVIVGAVAALFTARRTARQGKR
jgi:hypothetical protein